MVDGVQGLNRLAPPAALQEEKVHVLKIFSNVSACVGVEVRVRACVCAFARL